jgi:hypothetical protein
MRHPGVRDVAVPGQPGAPEHGAEAAGVGEPLGGYPFVVVLDPGSRSRACRPASMPGDGHPRHDASKATMAPAGRPPVVRAAHVTGGGIDHRPSADRDEHRGG